MGFDKKVCTALGTKVEIALKEVFKDSGFDVVKDGGKFEDLEFTMKIKFTITDGETKAHKDYREFADSLSGKHFGSLTGLSNGFPPDMLDATFPYGTIGAITVIGYLPNRPKMDILFLNSKGQERIAPSKSVIKWYERHIGNDPAADGREAARISGE